MLMFPFDGIVGFEKKTAELSGVGYADTLMLEIKPRTTKIQRYFRSGMAEKKKGERDV